MNNKRLVLALFALLLTPDTRLLPDELTIPPTKITPAPLMVFGETNLSHSGAHVLSMRFSDGGRTLISIGQDGTLLQSDTSTGRERLRLKLLTREEDGLAAATLSDDGTIAIYVTHFGRLGVIHIPSRKSVVAYLPFSCSIIDVAISPSNSRAVILNEEGSVLLLNIALPQLPRLRKITERGKYTGVAFETNDRVLLFGAGSLSSLPIVDAAERNETTLSDTPARVLIGRSAQTNTLRIERDTRNVIISADPTILETYNLDTTNRRTSKNTTPQHVRDFQILRSDHDPNVLLLSDDNVLTIATWPSIATKQLTHIDDIGDVHRIVATKTLVAVAGRKGIKLLRSDDISKTISKSNNFFGPAVYAAQLRNNLVLVAYSDRLVRLYDSEGVAQSTYETRARISSAAIADPANTLVLGMNNGTVEALRIHEATLTHLWKRQLVHGVTDSISTGDRRIEYPVRVVFLPETRSFCAVSTTGVVSIMEQSGDELHRLTASPPPHVMSAHFDQSVNRLFLTGHGLQVWNTTTMTQCFSNLLIRDEPVRHMADLGGGSLALSAGNHIYRFTLDSTAPSFVRLTDRDAPHVSPICALTCNGALVSSADTDGRIVVFRREPWTLLRHFSHPSPATDVRFAERRIIGTFQNGETVMWSLDDL